MTKISLDLPDETHIALLEIQLDRKKRKIEPTAINKIAVEVLTSALVKTEKPAK